MNVADQRRDPHSLLNWTERVIRMRKECPEISWGDFAVLRTDVAEVLAIRYDWREHVAGDAAQLRRPEAPGRVSRCRVRARDLLVDVFDDNSSSGRDGRHTIDLDPYAWRWFRVGSPDNALYRRPL